MKSKLFISTVVLALSGISGAFAQHTLRVTITNIKETVGNVRVGLFDNAEKFLKEARDGKIVKASAHEITVAFDNLESGDYAVSVIHDKNENGELDSNFIGIPNEPYGFSNNAMGSFGPPSFDKAKMRVEETMKTSITLK